LAAILPDCDGLTIFFGSYRYAEGHRVWTHNLLVAGVLAAIVSGVAYRWDAATKIQQWLARRWQVFAFGGHVPEAPPRRTSEFWLWVAVGVAAAYSHLLMDILFSGGRSRLLWGDMMTWGVPLLWPFSHALWTYPTVPWGDVGATLILAAGMFAMLRRPKHIRLIAVGSLLAVAVYIFVRRPWS
jgi:membrane-bound metal-dependent hydrolase YbcI (DUF457 family)